jgi:hypothetical protein
MATVDKDGNDNDSDDNGDNGGLPLPNYTVLFI